ncbi:MAG: hypothetical protein UU10_C0022G0003 [Parcubacteria group bacterium GW2011_GWF1_40_6]|nr:MAG: hypothetical protein UU10_C0022G0003 [Parcubacteria group bacterium GW2011_GWF1_40_6]HLA29305.1 hypothetical protein [Syntrophales bacterium]
MRKETNGEYWIKHSSGMWTIGHGDESGQIGWKTRNMGLCHGEPMPLRNGPPDIVKELMRLNYGVV